MQRHRLRVSSAKIAMMRICVLLWVTAGVLSAAQSILPPLKELTLFSDVSIGATAEIIAITGQRFGEAMHITIPRSMTNAWDITAKIPLICPLRRNQTMVFDLAARSLSGSEPIFFAIEEKRDCTALGAWVIPLKQTWARSHFVFVAIRDYRAGEVLVSFHLAQRKQVVELADLKLCPGR